MDMLGWWD